MRRASYSLVRRTNELSRRRAFRTAAAGGDAAVRITTLPNKIRVATESTPGHFSSVGLYVDAGSRYETPTTSGVSHFLDRMAFQVRTVVALTRLYLTL
jgi:mitochondrial-processing peptidase subunit alpha